MGDEETLMVSLADTDEIYNFCKDNFVDFGSGSAND